MRILPPAVPSVRYKLKFVEVFAKKYARPNVVPTNSRGKEEPEPGRISMSKYVPLTVLKLLELLVIN